MTDSLTTFGDERIRFYFRHRKRIEEWAALGKEARQATLAAFASFGAEIAEAAADLDTEHRLDDVDGNYPRWLLRKPTWPFVGPDALVAVVLEAERQAITADSPSYAPYVGIRVGDPSGAGAGLRTALLGLATQPELKARGYRKGSGPYWPVFRRVVAPDGWWEDPEGWSRLLVDALREAWETFAPRIDEALAAVGYEGSAKPVATRGPTLATADTASGLAPKGGGRR